MARKNPGSVMEILALNPRRKKRTGKKAKKPEVMNMEGVKRRKRSRRRKVRRNPAPRPASKWRGRARRAVSHARGFLGGTGIGGALRSLFPLTIGAMAAKIAQRKFGDKTSEDGNWTWKDYMLAAVGTGVVGLGSRYLLKINPATSQKVIEGGLLLIAYKIITNELAPMNSTVKEWIGGPDEGVPIGYMGADEGSWQGFSIGDLYEDAYGRTFMLAEDGSWQNVAEDDRMMGAGEEYGSLVPPGAYGQDAYGQDAYGDLVPPGRMGADDYWPAGKGPRY